MIEILLLAHIVAGILSVTSSLSKLIPALTKTEKLFKPSIITVSASGFGLLFTGVSFGRFCLSALLLVVFLVVIRQLSLTTQNT